jgi:hypothetical protein
MVWRRRHRWRRNRKCQRRRYQASLGENLRESDGESKLGALLVKISAAASAKQKMKVMGISGVASMA